MEQMDKRILRKMGIEYEDLKSLKKRAIKKRVRKLV